MKSPRAPMPGPSRAKGEAPGLAEEEEAAPARRSDGEAMARLNPRSSDVTAHDLKNIFNSLGLYLELVQRSAERGDCEAIRGQVAVMKQSVHRGVEAIGRMRKGGDGLQDGSRRGALSPGLDPGQAPQELELNDLVREACAIARPTSPGAHRVRQALAPTARIFGSSMDIVSALVNLAVNAFEAFEASSGDVPSSSRGRSSPGGTVTFETGRSAQRVWVLVADDGPGMPPEVERRAFEPFFTTKGDRGTGLGLAMVQACMQRHGGRVTLETAAGQGARFTLIFPSPRSGRELPASERPTAAAE